MGKNVDETTRLGENSSGNTDAFENLGWP